MDLNTRNNILTVVLAVLIVILSWFLYRSLTEPYQRVIEEEQMVERVRYRMELVRDALVQYNTRKGHFPPSDGGLDSLVQFLKTDSLMVARGDSMLTFMEPSTYSPDSIVYSPRPPHVRFEYTLNDTVNPEIYLLKNPNSEDAIGSLERTTMLNAPNWN